MCFAIVILSLDYHQWLPIMSKQSCCFDRELGRGDDSTRCMVCDQQDRAESSTVDSSCSRSQRVDTAICAQTRSNRPCALTHKQLKSAAHSALRVVRPPLRYG